MQRERITITIDADLLPAVDTLIDGDKIRNRSHALEYAVRKGLAPQEIRQAFFIYSNNSLGPDQLKHLALLCDQLEIKEYFTIDPSSSFAEADLWQRSLIQHTLHPETNPTLLPGDFGSGGALLLRQQSISPSFLLVEVAKLSELPRSLLSAYSTHRQHGSYLTHLLRSTGADFQVSGLCFAQAEILSAIPAGVANLATDVFPGLVKAGKVSTYVYPTS